MKDVGAPEFLWAEAFATAIYAINQMISIGGKTLFNAFFGQKPDVAHMWV